MDQTLSRHILVQPSEIRTENQAELLIKDIHRRLLEGEDFKQLADNILKIQDQRWMVVTLVG